MFCWWQHAAWLYSSGGSAKTRSLERVPTTEKGVKITVSRMLALAAAFGIGSQAGAQEMPDIGFKSVGRSWPPSADYRETEQLGPRLRRNRQNPEDQGEFLGSARNGAVPPGIEPLPV